MVRVRCIRCKAPTDSPARGLVGSRLGQKIAHECRTGECRERAMRHATTTRDIDVGWIAAAWTPKGEN